MLERKIIDIELPDSKEKLKVRRVNASEVILILGYLPDFFSEMASDGSNASKLITAKSIEATGKWACAGIVKHDSKKIVPSLEPKEDEYSYYELSDADQMQLFTTVFTGAPMDGKKK